MKVKTILNCETSEDFVAVLNQRKKTFAESGMSFNPHTVNRLSLGWITDIVRYGEHLTYEEKVNRINQLLMAVEWFNIHAN